MLELSLRKQLHSAQGSLALDVDLRIERGAFTALFGPSGAGKTTLLRCLAGLTQPAAGRIRFGDDCWFDHDRGVNLPPQRRRVGFMFQDYALFPNMTVRGNLEFARRADTPRRRVDEMIEMMELGELQHRKPARLSGGQQQRVALARTLLAAPQLLLLDEPFAALDAAIRLRLQNELLALQRRYGLTTLMVSHDLGEVYRLAQQVFVLEGGRLARQGSPAQVFSADRTDGKFSFTGEVLAIEATDVVYAVTVRVGNRIVRVIASRAEAARLQVGCQVALLAKAFNPNILRIDQAWGQISNLSPFNHKPP
jgi:molybdate transport system ATP-binding protein